MWGAEGLNALNSGGLQVRVQLLDWPGKPLGVGGFGVSAFGFGLIFVGHLCFSPCVFLMALVWSTSSFEMFY